MYGMRSPSATSAPAPAAHFSAALVCTAVAVLGLGLAVRNVGTQLVVAPRTRPLLTSAPATFPAPVTRVLPLQATAPDSDDVPSGLSAPQQVAGRNFGAAALPLALLGSALGFAAAFFTRQGAVRQATADEEAPRRAPWGVGLAAAAALSIPTALAPADLMPAALANLPGSDPISNPEALLRYSLPISNKEIRQVQRELESISRQLRIPGKKPIGPIQASVSTAQKIVTGDRTRKAIIADFAPDKRDEGLVALEELKESLEAFQTGLQDSDKQLIPLYQEDALKKVGKVEEAMVKGFPFEVPAKYARLPQLKGRATVEVQMKFVNNINVEEATLVLVLDGYNAPVSAGNFMDLVNKGFYDGMTIQRADGFVVQFGKPAKSDGYKDPSTGEVRRIPFEVRVKGDRDAYYEATLEELGVYNAPVELPFNAFGTMALARAEFQPNSASSQVFWLLKDNELTPVGSNVLDGQFAAFGYITRNQDLLKEMKVGDEIVSMKVVAGQENFVPGDADAPPVEFES